MIRAEEALNKNFLLILSRFAKDLSEYRRLSHFQIQKSKPNSYISEMATLIKSFRDELIVFIDLELSRDKLSQIRNIRLLLIEEF